MAGKKVKEIIHGYTNLLFKKEHIEQVAKERMEICKKCEHISTKHKTVRKDIHCTVCGCVLQAKVRSMLSECPINKWGKQEKQQ